MDTNPLAETAEETVRRNRQIKDEKGRLKQMMAEEMKPHYLADSEQASPSGLMHGHGAHLAKRPLLLSLWRCVIGWIRHKH